MAIHALQFRIKVHSASMPMSARFISFQVRGQIVIFGEFSGCFGIFVRQFLATRYRFHEFRG